MLSWARNRRKHLARTVKVEKIPCAGLTRIRLWVYTFNHQRQQLCISSEGLASSIHTYEDVVQVQQSTVSRERCMDHFCQKNLSFCTSLEACRNARVVRSVENRQYAASSTALSYLQHATRRYEGKA